MGVMKTGSKGEECEVGSCDERVRHVVSVRLLWNENFTMRVCAGHEFEFTERTHISTVEDV
jgi:hypothetical protein